MGKRRIKGYKPFMHAPTRDHVVALQGTLLFALVAASACGKDEKIMWRTRAVYSASPEAGERGVTDPNGVQFSGGRGGGIATPAGWSGAAGDSGPGTDGGAVFGTDGGAGGHAGADTAGASSASELMERCYTNDDCDDGLYCNGVELCLPKSEGSDIQVCKVPETGPCGPSACDEASDTCDCSDPDQDHDSFLVKGCAGDGLPDCDDLDGGRRPKNAETCEGDPEHDEDCRDETYGDKDVDGDLFVDPICANARWYQATTATPKTLEKYQGTDCNDELPGVNPKAEERCDNEDNNCNGIIDEVSGAPLGEARTYYKDADADHWGDAKDTIETLCNTPPFGYTTLKGDCNDGNWEFSPAREEICNDEDDDCNGTTDQPLAEGGLMFDEPLVPGTEFECTGRPGWKVKTCPPDRLDCGNQNVLDGCETVATTLCNCRACGTTCAFSCGESACEEIHEISAGNLHTCALVAAAPAAGSPLAGSVACWGRNSWGQLGDGGTKDSALPIRVQDLALVTAIASGARHSCAISDGKLFCWGSNENGRLGSGGTQPLVSFPVAVQPAGFSERAIQVAAGASHTCAIYDEGRLSCWGLGDMGQLGIGGEGEGFGSAVPMRVSREVNGGLEYILDSTQVVAGFSHTCSISAGRVECWGDNSTGQLGVSPDDLATSTVARAVPGLDGIVIDEIAAAAVHTCGRAGSDVYCWGSNIDHELANDDGAIGLPVRVDLPADAVAIVAGVFFNCALTRPGDIYCWGSNYHGERGMIEELPAITPTRVPLTLAASVFGGNGYHACANTSAGVWCWGRNDYGQLGLAETSEQVGPKRVLPLGGSQNCSR